MAEVVQRQSENMLRELEDLRETKLLPEEFIRRVLKMRRQMESKISGNVTKNVDDYKNYIHHEILILEKLRKCRDKKKIADKKTSVEFSIIKRIRRLYETALQRFPSDYVLHESFFSFCKQNGFNSTASQAVETMLKLFPYESEVWKMAANWYRHMDLEKATETLRKGLTIIPGSTLLYTTAIEAELDHLKQINSLQGEKAFEINESCENIKVYVTLMLNNIKSLDFIIVILRSLQEHSCTNESQEIILEFLMKNHDTDDIVWHTLAVRERKGMHYQTDPNEKPRSGSFTKSCIIYCIDKYKQGLTMVMENRKKKLWSSYLETLISINEENHTSASVSRIDSLKGALEEAHKGGYLEERHYKVWSEMLPAEEKKKILEESTDMYPQSEELWKLRLKCVIESDKIALINSTFKLAVAALKEKALSLWLMVLRFYLLVSDNSRIKSIFEDGIHQPYEVSNIIKSKYIEWTYFHEGMEAARKKYRTIALLKPYSKEVHLQMSKLEFGEMDVNTEAWMAVHELACEQLGSEDVDVWVNFVKFLIFRERDERSGELMAKIQNDAKQRLPALLWVQFKEVYDKLIAASV